VSFLRTFIDRERVHNCSFFVVEEMKIDEKEI
jgi:hypothetical protein